MIVILPYFLTGGQIEWPTFSPWRFFKILQDSSRFFFKILQDSSRFLNPISAIISSLKPGKRNRLEECPQGMTVRIPRIPPLLPPRPTRRCHIYLSTRFHFRSFHPFFFLFLSLFLLSPCVAFFRRHQGPATPVLPNLTNSDPSFFSISPALSLLSLNISLNMAKM